MSNRVVHFEMFGRDAAAMREFYERVFGWKIEGWPGPFEYFLATTGEEGEPGINGAIAPPGTITTQAVVTTIDVPDIDAAIEAILANGGAMIMPKAPVPGVGWTAYFSDSVGIISALMQADTSAA